MRLIPLEADMQLSVGFAGIPYFCWNWLLPTIFTCCCPNYVPQGREQLVHLQTFWTTVLSFVSWKLIVTFSGFAIVPENVSLLVSSMKLFPGPMGLGLIVAYCVKTAQGKNHINPPLISKNNEQGQTGSFFFVLLCSTGIVLKCTVCPPVCHPRDNTLHWDSLANRMVTLQSYIRSFWCSLCCVKALEAHDATSQINTWFAEWTFLLLCLAEVFVDNQENLKPQEEVKPRREVGDGFIGKLKWWVWRFVLINC